MRILLISVSKKWQGRVYKEYPHGVGILGTIAHNEGHTVKILDMALDESNPIETIREFKPDVIGLSFLSPSLNEAKSLIKSINKVYNGHLYAGGIHSTLYPKEVINLGVDIVNIGEGELVILKLLECLSKSVKGKYSDDIKSIPNIFYRDHTGEIIENVKSKESVNLDTLPIMNRDLFDMNLYSHHSILTSRGCPYKCKFCCSWAPGGKSGRVMSKDRIMKELLYLVEKFGELKLYWADEIFFWTEKDRIDFCKMLEIANLPIEITIQVRADLVTDELMKALKSAGCSKICIGAESGSDKILMEANKKVKSSDIENAIKICAANGIKSKTWWIVGLPGGGKKEQLETLDLIGRARPNEVAIHQFVPLPGSEFWNKAEEYGINFPEEDMYETLNYYSDGRAFSFDYLSQNEIDAILEIYESKLKELGYIPTDLADDDSEYIYTSPFQKTTFKI